MPCGARPDFMVCGDAELVLRNTFIRITLLTRLMRLQLLLVVLLVVLLVALRLVASKHHSRALQYAH